MMDLTLARSNGAYVGVAEIGLQFHFLFVYHDLEIEMFLLYNVAVFWWTASCNIKFKSQFLVNFIL